MKEIYINKIKINSGDFMDTVTKLEMHSLNQLLAELDSDSITRAISLES